ncbi:MAG: sigma-70 family RNA polymerase sigma factor [Planctomycetaceae bacterium]
MSERPANAFHTTRWTQVLAARGSSPEAKRLLRELCETYYAPVELFVRRYRGGDDARDLTHEFIAKLLEGNSLAHLDRTRGRFRSYLLGAVKHFLADFEDRQQAARRGGDRQPQSCERQGASRRSIDIPPVASAIPLTFEIADPHGFPSDEFFDRQWAVAIVDQAIETLRHEAVAAGDQVRFDILKRWLVAPADQDTTIAAAHSLNITEEALRVAVHRLRKRFREAVKSRIADTVSDPADITDELSYLISALATSPRESL